nr:retrovirus-related Pol polyprotein from transposon TNT 1-94 [Tanacetum cinerariifolium]
MLSDNHDFCVLNVINDVNACLKYKSVKKTSKRKVWKPTRKVFTKTGYTWRPTGWTFTIVGNAFSLTRITTTAEVPLRKPTALETDTPKHGSIVLDVPSSSLDECRVYYMEGLGHNLFSIGQLCDSNLEVAFRQHTCFISNLEGVDLLTGSRGNNLYTFSLGDMMASSPICLLSKASKTKSWLWHRRLSHLNFGAINHLARHGLVRGKTKKKPHKPKSKDTNQEKLYLLYLDICGPIRVASVNGKKYILVIVDDYSRFTWVKCLRTGNETEFVNQTLREYYEKVDISHETSVARSPQQNGVVERRNQVVATACFTQNRSIIRLRYGKTPHELLHSKLPDLSFFHVFGALCYPTNDSENLVASEPATSIGSPSSTTVDQDAPSPKNVSEASFSLDVIPTVVHTAAPNIEHGRIMLIYAKASLFLWPEAAAATCYTHNRSIIHIRHSKTPYELLHDKLPLSFFHVFGVLCYPTNDSENLGKLQPKDDIGIFIVYALTKKAF